MDIRLGTLRVNLSSLVLYDNTGGKPLARKYRILNRQKRFYRWNCANQTGRPVPRPARRSYQANAHILFPDLFGAEDKKEAAAFLGRLVGAAGFAKPADLNRALNRALPPLTVPVEWSQLLDPHKADYSLDFYERIHYLRFLARPNGLNPSDYFYMFVPHLVTFSVRIIGRCSGTKPNGTWLTGWSPHIMPGRVLARLERQAALEEREADAREEAEEDLTPSWLGPTHELEDEIDPEDD